MEIYSIGFTHKSAEQFFTILKRAGIRRLMDIRLNNLSQLAGFSKRDDLRYFVGELCGAEYVYEPLLAPTQAILDAYRKEKGSWEQYEKRFRALIRERRIDQRIDKAQFRVPTVLLCSEPTADRCHRRLVLEFWRERWGNLTITHL